jgi:hypothetical protein
MKMKWMGEEATANEPNRAMISAYEVEEILKPIVS